MSLESLGVERISPSAGAIVTIGAENDPEYLSRHSDEDATVFALEADCGAAIAQFIESRFPSNQTGAAKHLGIHQSEVSAILAANLARFSISKLIRIARRAGLRLYIDMGDRAEEATVIVLKPRIVVIP